MRSRKAALILPTGDHGTGIDSETVNHTPREILLGGIVAVLWCLQVHAFHAPDEHDGQVREMCA